MGYSYTNGDGVSVLLVNEPDGDTEPVSNLDDAIKQIKLFLNDPKAGWPYMLTALGIAANAGNKNFFSAYSNANQTIPATTETKVAMGLEQADPDSVFDPSTSRFTAPVTGWYKFTVSIRVDWLSAAGVTTGVFHIKLKKNGSVNVAASETNLSSFDGATYSIERSVSLNAGDYVELFAYYMLDTGTVVCQLTSDITKTAFQGLRSL